jgi:hypothetical protein
MGRGLRRGSCTNLGLKGYFGHQVEDRLVGGTVTKVEADKSVRTHLN